MSKVKKFFVDRMYYNLNADKIYGDMTYTFDDMPNMEFNTIKKAKEAIDYEMDYVISEQLDNDETFDGNIFIYTIWESVFDASNTVVSTKEIYAKCMLISDDSIYEELNKCWRRTHDFDVDMYV